MSDDQHIDREALEAFAWNWLSGSTCHRHTRTVHWASDDHRFVLMKHHGHTEYVNRVSGSTRCGTFYALYDLTQARPGAFGKPCMWKVEGRWLASHWDELKRRVAESTAAHQ